MDAEEWCVDGSSGKAGENRQASLRLLLVMSTWTPEISRTACGFWKGACSARRWKGKFLLVDTRVERTYD